MPSIKFKVELRGYDKKTDLMVKEEFSKVFDDDDTIINELGLRFLTIPLIKAYLMYLLDG